MKNTTNSDYIKNIITSLDEMLLEGHIKYHQSREGYNQNKDLQDFDVQKYIQTVVDTLNNWYGAVYKILDEQVQEKHHLFHFVQHKSHSMSMIGVPIELSNLLFNFEYYLYALEDVILRLEERNSLEIRREIAEKKYEIDTLYKITYSDHTREIKLNGMVLARLQSDSKNVNFFEYVYTHQNQQIDVKTIEENTAYDLANNIHDILRDLGFKGNIRKIFFPIATKIKVMFVNPITKQYAIKNDLPTIELHKTTRQDEK